MLSRFPIIVAGAALVLAFPGMAAGTEGDGDSATAGRYRIGVGGHVPVICRVSIDSPLVPDTAGRVSLGTMKEFCNNPAGYRVIVERSSLAGSAILIVDGREILLNSGQSVVVAQSARAAVAARKVELEIGTGGQAGALAFRIEPL